MGWGCSNEVLPEFVLDRLVLSLPANTFRDYLGLALPLNPNRPFLQIGTFDLLDCVLCASPERLQMSKEGVLLLRKPFPG